MQRAARFLFLQRCAFSGKVTGQAFGVSTRHSGPLNMVKLEADIDALHARLSGVSVTSMDCLDFIRRVDRKDTLFYLDPPYWGNESDYGKELFGREMFTELAGVLRDLKGRFIMSLNDTPGVRDVFADFCIEEVRTSYSINPKGDASGARGEVLISG